MIMLLFSFLSLSAFSHRLSRPASIHLTALPPLLLKPAFPFSPFSSLLTSFPSFPLFVSCFWCLISSFLVHFHSHQSIYHPLFAQSLSIPPPPALFLCFLPLPLLPLHLLSTLYLPLSVSSSSFDPHRLTYHPSPLPYLHPALSSLSLLSFFLLHYHFLASSSVFSLPSWPSPQFAFISSCLPPLHLSSTLHLLQHPSLFVREKRKMVSCRSHCSPSQILAISCGEKTDGGTETWRR